MFIDIHTHRRQPAGGTSIYNLTPGEEPCEGFFSAGVHPWQADQFSPASAIAQLESLQKHPQFVVVGEIGIDRACDVSLPQQIALFEAQLQWASQHAKPVTIHCVRAYSDVLQVLKRNRHLPALLFHAYIANEQTTIQLSKYDAYFSLGHRELSRKGDLRHIPLDKLFLETDEQPVDIRDVYELASEKLGIAIRELETIVEQNAERLLENGWCFGL